MSEQRGRVRVEPGHKRVRAFLGGALVADTTRPLLVWENPHYPAYYLPLPDVRQELLESSTRTEHSPSRGEARYYSVRVGTRRAEDAAWTYPESPIEDLRGTLRVEWDAMDGWFEEDEEVFVHPRSPYVRVDALRSTRSVRIELDGAVLAASSSPVMVFETGLPTRYYLNRTEVNFAPLRPSDTVTSCPGM